MQTPLVKGSQLYRTDSFTVFATEVPEVVLLEWDDPQVGDLAWRMHDTLRRHTQPTNALERIGAGLMTARQLELLGVLVEAHANAHETTVRFLSGRSERELEGRALTRMPDVSSRRADVMQDAAAHCARSLRAHLLTHGVPELTLRLHFGLDDSSCLQLQVVDPRECNLGTTDYAKLYDWLGGD